MISSFGTEESVLQRHDKANNAVCLQYMVRVLHWEFAEGFSSGQYKTGTADCGLGIKYGLGIKRGLENTDWV